MTPQISPVIFCELLPQTRERIEEFAEDLKQEAHKIGRHGLSARQFQDSGILYGAIERLRGQRAASMEEKRDFMAEVLNHLKKRNEIKDWTFEGAGERYDYVVRMRDGRVSVVETKGCLDGNNTNIFERPPQADEFIIWSLCQNPGADPRHNAWSGIHTRLGAEIIHRQQKVDGLVIWDMLCGTPGRPCPKLVENPRRGTILAGRSVPPPCLYLFPRSIPDPRNNPSPPCWNLNDVRLLGALWRVFKGDEADVVDIQIEARMEAADVQRKTRLVRAGAEIATSDWTTLKRARR